MLDRGGVAVDAGLDPRSAHFARCVRSLLAGDGYRTSGVDGGKRRRHRRAEGGHTSVNLQAFAGARPNGQDSRGWRAQRFSERFWACWVLAGLALAIVLLVVGWRSGAVSFLVTLFGLTVFLLLLMYFYGWREAHLARTTAPGTIFRGAAAVPIDGGLPRRSRTKSSREQSETESELRWRGSRAGRFNSLARVSSGGLTRYPDVGVSGRSRSPGPRCGARKYRSTGSYG
jgi:hypothetical protein